MDVIEKQKFPLGSSQEYRMRDSLNQNVPQSKDIRPLVSDSLTAFAQMKQQPDSVPYKQPVFNKKASQLFNNLIKNPSPLQYLRSFSEQQYETMFGDVASD